jgi:hypothetical protein
MLIDLLLQYGLLVIAVVIAFAISSIVAMLVVRLLATRHPLDRVPDDPGSRLTRADPEDVVTPGRRAFSLGRLHDPVSLASPRVLARWRASTIVRLRSPVHPERRALNPLSGDRFSAASTPVGGPRRRRGDRPPGDD